MLISNWWDIADRCDFLITSYAMRFHPYSMVTNSVVQEQHIKKYERKTSGKKKEVKKGTALPKPLVKQLNQLSLSALHFNRAVSIISTIIRESRKKKVSLDSFIAIPSSFWKKHIANHYELSLHPLIDENIIQDTGYSTLTNSCKRYRINPSLLGGTPKLVRYDDIRTVNGREPECIHTLKMMRTMKLDVVAAKKTVEEYISSGNYKRDIVINPDLPVKEVIKLENFQKFNLSSQHYSFGFLREFAVRKNMSIIQDHQKYYISQPDIYFRNKATNIRIHYYDAIYRFQMRDFYARRNDTNFRLDSNITSMPSILLKHITIDGEHLCSFDLSNSQFNIHASMILNGFFEFTFPNLLPVVSVPITSEITYSPSKNSLFTTNHYHTITPTSLSSKEYIVTYMCAQFKGVGGVTKFYNPVISVDVEHYIKFAKSGTLYEVIAANMAGIGTRRMAKQLMFRLFFSGHRDTSHHKKVIKGIFPNVVRMIDEYKKVHGDNTFAIALQRVESRIFVDRILNTLISRGCKVISKHDSILFPPSEYKTVQSVMADILDEELGVYELKYEILK